MERYDNRLSVVLCLVCIALMLAISEYIGAGIFFIVLIVAAFTHGKRKTKFK